MKAREVLKSELLFPPEKKKINPLLMLIIVLIVLLAMSSLYVLYTYSEEFKKLIDTFIDRFKEIFLPYS